MLRQANAAADTLSRFPQRNQDEENEPQVKNGQIFHYLQNLLTNASLASLSFFAPSHLHQVLIFRTYVLSQLCYFWNGLQGKLTSKGSYKASIGGMRLRLQELQAKNEQAQKTRVEHSESWDNINGVLHYQGLFYVPEIIQTELISRHHHVLLAGHFGIEKTQELIAWNYYWPTLCRDVKDYVKRCNIYLVSKTIRHKPYGDLQSLPVPIYHWKNLSIDFITGLPISTNWKRNSYVSILVIINWLTKMVYYKPVKVTIDAPGLAAIIINVVVRHHGLSDSIVTNRGSLFTSKFWSFLCYFLGIKQKLSTAFYPQTDDQTKR